MDNVVFIAVHVNDTLKAFKESGKPAWAAGVSVKLADRYAAAWHSNYKLLAQMEYNCKKAQDITRGKDLGATQ